MGALRLLAPASAAAACIGLLALGGCSLNPPRFTPAETDGLPAEVELTQVPFFPQKQYQCGPAALATVLRSAGAAGSPDELVGEVYLPGRKGSLQVELVAAARSRDRLVYPISQDLPALMRQVAAGTPVLVMQNLGVKLIPIWHYAVVVGYDLEAGTLVLRSGTTQRRVMGMRRFMSTWNRAERWALVVLEPRKLPAGAQLDRYGRSRPVGRSRAGLRSGTRRVARLGLAAARPRQSQLPARRPAGRGGRVSCGARARSAQRRRPQQSRGNSRRSWLRVAGTGAR